ncbi:MAG TPA: hypothetical protein VJ810_23630 [Blastocatellia bacterium]|nr:hypothetical protein [Blastocatellia bacterium]
MKRKQSIKKLCPAACSGGYAESQITISKEQIKLPLDKLAKLPSSLRRCGYCGLVWSPDKGKIGWQEGGGFRRYGVRAAK